MPSLLSSTLNTRALPTGDLRFLRSDCPEKLTPEEIAWLRQNRVTTVVDLRERKEYEKRPCCLEAEAGFTYYHMPVTGGGDPPKSPADVALVYLGMLDEQMERILQTILTAKTNVLYFCAAGKDRTGVVSALLLKKLGYDDRTILEDYMKSKENLLDLLTNYAKAHPQVDINTILPNENNLKAVLAAVSK